MVLLGFGWQRLFFRAVTVQMIIVVVILGLAVFPCGEYFAQLFTRNQNVLPDQ